MTDAHWRVLIVDDHEVTRHGVRALLTAVEGAEVVGEAANGRDAVSLCKQLHPDVVLMDLHMPGGDGVTAIREIKQIPPPAPDIAVVVLTVVDDEDEILEAIRAGASGYLSKSSSAAEIQGALELLSPKGVQLSGDVAARIVRRLLVAPSVQHAENGSGLTPREEEVLTMLAEGLSARVIARRLTISERTVTSHLDHAYRKLGVNNRVDAVREAIVRGVVDPGEWASERVE